MEPKNIHHRLKEVREKVGMSQTLLAIQLGVTPSYVSAMERGSKNITRKVIEKLIELFEVSADWLISGTGSMSFSENVLPISEGLSYQSAKSSVSDTKKVSNKSFNFRSTLASDKAEADKIRNTVQASAVGGEGARHWARRRIHEARIYKLHPSAESATLTDYVLVSGLGQDIDKLLVELVNIVQGKVDKVLDEAIDRKLTLPQAAEKIKKVTAPLNSLQPYIEALETAIFQLARAAADQYPHLQSISKSSPLYFNMAEWGEDNEKGPETAK